jgi:hypothetical protein
LYEKYVSPEFLEALEKLDIRVEGVERTSFQLRGNRIEQVQHPRITQLASSTSSVPLAPEYVLRTDGLSYEQAGYMSNEALALQRKRQAAYTDLRARALERKLVRTMSPVSRAGAPRSR